MATLLDTPDDWETNYNQIVRDGRIIRMLNRFIALLLKALFNFNLLVSFQLSLTVLMLIWSQARKQKSSLEVSWLDMKANATFVSGYIDGQPLYSTVRVLPQEVVTRIEDEITLQEKAEFKQQASEVTLFE